MMTDSLKPLLMDQITSNNKKALIFLENREQAIDFITWNGTIDNEKIIIALSPGAMFELDKANIVYSIAEDYYTLDELYRIGFGNFVHVENLCKIIDFEIQQHEPEFKEHGIMPAMFSYYFMKPTYDTIVTKIFQVTKILNYENPSHVYVYQSQKYPFGTSDSAPYIFFDQRETFLSNILSLKKWDFTIQIVDIKIKQKDNKTKQTKTSIYPTIRKKAVKRLTNNPILYDLALGLQKEGFNGFFYWLNNLVSHEEKTAVLLYGSGYNWDDSFNYLSAKRIYPIYRIFDDFNWLNLANNPNLKNIGNVWSKLESNIEVKNILTYNDIDFSTILKDRIEYLINDMSKACLLAFHETTKYIKVKKINAIIASMLSTCVAHSVAQAAHKSNIPVITWQHGGYGMSESHPLVDYIDIINSDYHFVFGEGVLESLSESAGKYGTQLVEIGSASLERIESRNTEVKTNSKRQKILYATSAYLGNNNFISTYPPCLDSLFWTTQKEIVDFLGKYPENSVTVKLHPSTGHTHILESYVYDKGYPNFKFITNEKTFTELLPLTDVVIIDLPYTTILQALMTNKPIFAYTGHHHYNNVAHDTLSKRAICPKELDIFISELEQYMSAGIYKANIKNTDFIKLYGISSNNGSIQKRAAQKLKDIINRSNDAK